jgi:5-methylcytosine-specific restriction endonuclease McrA
VVCGQPLRIAEEDCQIHHRIWRTRGGQDTADNLELLHANCHRQIHVREGRTKTTASREGRSGRLELDEGKLCAAERGVESLTQSGGARRVAPGSSD